MTAADPRPCIVHIVYRFDVGGLENGVVNLVNRLPAESYRHVIVALTEITDFRRRVTRDDVRFVELRKSPGHGYRLFPRLYRLFREIAPDIVHTRNLAALEAMVPALAAGVPARIHGEHGRDVGDLDGSSRRYRLVRKIYRPFVTKYVALSKDLERYLEGPIGVPASRIEQIYNGVDTESFTPSPDVRAPIEGCPFDRSSCFLVGTVGRMQAVKNPLALARSFARAVRSRTRGHNLRLVMVGDGPQRGDVEAALTEAGVRDLAWLPGERSDIPAIMRGLDCFVLPSLAEGISNTVLEAMASGIPVVATRVGGNPELIDDESTGRLVPSGNDEALTAAMLRYFDDPAAARRHGGAARSAVVRRFSLDRMVQDYRTLYDSTRKRRLASAARAPTHRSEAKS
jgi:sugar transferase (PEP-CTERM/EpsH1 system associated)